MSARNRTLLLMGAGSNNLHIASLLARLKAPPFEVLCIANEEQVINPAMLPGLVAGQYSLAESSWTVQHMLEKFQVQWIQDKVTAISASNNSVQLRSGHTLAFDWLSINTTPLQHREYIEKALPGAKKNGFFLYPMEQFVHHWEQVCSDAASNALRIAVIGNSMRSMEIALAVRQRLPHAAVTLVMQQPIEQNLLPTATLLLQTLKKHRITVLHDTALSCSASHVHLGCGADLACDIPIMTQEPHAPPWLSDKNRHIFFWPLHHVQQTRRMVHTVLGKEDNQVPMRTKRHMHTFYNGNHSAIAQWGNHTLHGRITGWLKHYKDKRLIN